MHNFLNYKYNYYPFGSSTPGRSFSSGSYRYGMSGMEKDDEVKGSGNSYTTLFRQYDSRLGRWLSNDPKIHAWESPYVSMGNNPILNNDILGDEFDPKSKKHVDAYETKLGERIKEVDNQITNTQNKIADLQKSLSLESDPTKKEMLNKDVTNNQSQLAELNQAKVHLTDAVTELGMMKNSTQLFKVRDNFKGGGSTTYDTKGNAVLIRFDGEFSSIGHELKHGAQFLSGELSFDRKTGNAGNLADLFDEQGAYHRQLALDPNSFNRPNIKFSDITRPKIQNQREGNSFPYADFPDENRTKSNYKGDLSNDIIFQK